MRKDILKLIKHLFIVAVLLSCILPTSLKSQTNWTNYSGNPVINSDFDPGAIAIVRPSVLFDGVSYHMWYSSVRVFPIADNQFHLGCMGYATSPDGISWQSVEPVVIGPVLNANDFDMMFASQGWVIADRDTFKMWYWGLNPTLEGNVLNSIGYAWSLDGSNWNRMAGTGTLGSVYDRYMADLPDSSGVAMPCVVKDGGTYHMWYCHVVGDYFRIGYATSSDGIHWTKVNGTGRNGSVIDWGPSGSFDQVSAQWPTVIKTDDGFMMWYYGFDGSTPRIGCSISTDGMNWNPAPGVDASGACFEGALGTCVILMGTQYKMWYAPGNPDQVNLAFSDYTTDVSRSENPVRQNNFKLEQNFPNPFNPSTKIEYIVKETCHVNLVIYSLNGQIVKEIVNFYQHPGIYSITLNMQEIPSGIYFCKIRMGDFQAVKKMIKIE
jgi:hypothetical protein